MLLSHWTWLLCTVLSCHTFYSKEICSQCPIFWKMAIHVTSHPRVNTLFDGMECVMYHKYKFLSNLLQSTSHLLWTEILNTQVTLFSDNCGPISRVKLFITLIQPIIFMIKPPGVITFHIHTCVTCARVEVPIQENMFSVPKYNIVLGDGCMITTRS